MTPATVLAINAKSTPETIYEALTTGQGLASFWTRDSQATPEVGSIASFGFGPEARLQMKVEELVPGKRVVWSSHSGFPDWEGSKVAWTIKPGADGATMVVFRQDGWLKEIADPALGSVNQTWAEIMTRLRGYAETGEAQPFFG